jgi:predicted nucleotidyltransferase
MKSNLATLVLRVPSSLHQLLKQEARRTDMSLNKHCNSLLRAKPRSASAERGTSAVTFASSYPQQPERLENLAAQWIEILGDKVEGVAVFGSFARGRSTATSDIDLLIVLSEHLKFDRDIYSQWKPCKFDGREVSPLFVQIPREEERIGGLWFEVALDAILLYDKALKVSRFLSHVRGLVAEGQVKRMVTHGHPYWVYADRTSPDTSIKGDS